MHYSSVLSETEKDSFMFINPEIKSKEKKCLKAFKCSSRTVMKENEKVIRQLKRHLISQVEHYKFFFLKYYLHLFYDIT